MNTQFFIMPNGEDVKVVPFVPDVPRHWYAATPTKRAMKHLRFCYLTAHDEKEDRHAQAVMKELGITYRISVPQSLGDQWWFLDCQNIPDVLPPYLTPMDDFDPQGAVGYGLSQEDADTLS